MNRREDVLGQPGIQECPAFLEGGGPWGIVGTERFSQSDGSGREPTETALTRVPEDQFRAAPSDVRDEQGAVGEGGRGAHAAKGEFSLLLAGDDFDGDSRDSQDDSLEGADEVAGFFGFPSRGGRDDSEAGRLMENSSRRKRGDRRRGAVDGGGLESARGEEPLAKASLVPFDDGFDPIPGDARDQEFDRNWCRRHR